MLIIFGLVEAIPDRSVGLVGPVVDLPIDYSRPQTGQMIDHGQSDQFDDR